MDIEKQENFIEVAAVPGNPFFSDIEHRLSLAVELELEEIKELLDGVISIGASKPAQGTVALSLAVASQGEPRFVKRMVLNLGENGDELAEYTDKEKQFLSFFYTIGNKKYYALSTSVRFSVELKEDIRKLMRNDHPALHKISLSQIDINALKKYKFFMYRDADMAEPVFLHDYLMEKAKKDEMVTVWWGMDQKGKYMLSNEGEINGASGLLCDPLKSGAIPFGSCHGNEAVIFVTDKEGFDLLCVHGNRKLYEKNYNFWH